MKGVLVFGLILIVLTAACAQQAPESTTPPQTTQPPETQPPTATSSVEFTFVNCFSGEVDFAFRNNGNSTISGTSITALLDGRMLPIAFTELGADSVSTIYVYTSMNLTVASTHTLRLTTPVGAAERQFTCT